MIKNIFKLNYDPMPKPLRKGKVLFVFCMVIVAVINFLVFYVAVNFESILLSFQKYVGQGVYEASLGQFAMIFDDLKLGMSGELLPAFLNTMIYFFTNLFLVLPLSYLVSYFVYKKIFAYKVFRVIFFMPSIVSAVVLVAIYKYFILPGGALDSFLYSAFGTHVSDTIMMENSSATLLILGYCIWSGFGVNIVLFQGAMKRIPDSITEAAMIDGAGMGVELFKIVIPMTFSTIIMQFTLAISAFMTASGPIMLFTEGGANTSTISFWLYWQIYKYNRYNYAAAVGILCTLITVPIVVISRYFISKLGENVEY